MLALIRQEAPRVSHRPQRKEQLNVAPKPPAIPATFVPEKRYPESKGAEECVWSLGGWSLRGEGVALLDARVLRYYNYMGEFRKGRLCGRGTYTFALGGTCTGEWRDNRQNGRAMATCVGGNVWWSMRLCRAVLVVVVVLTGVWQVQEWRFVRRRVAGRQVQWARHHAIP